MAGPAPRSLSLPEEFVLLSHLLSGEVHNLDQTAFGCAAAELGELALRRKLRVRSRKFRLFGLQAYQGTGKIQLLGTGRTGLVWADALLADLEIRAASGHEAISVGKWLRQRRYKALSLHQTALTQLRLLRKFHQSLYPDRAVRDVLINELRAARAEQVPLDGRLLFLFDLVDAAELTADFGLTLSMRQRLDHARGTGAVGHLPEDLRDTSTLLGFMIPSRRRGRVGVDGGGDGGGGGE